MKKIKVEVVKPHRYDGETRKVGDTYEASERDANVLETIGKVKKAKRTYQRRDMQPEQTEQ